MLYPNCFFVFLTVAVVSGGSTGTVQDDWISPTSPDYSNVLTANVQYTIEWDDSVASDLATYCPECDPTDVELWMQGARKQDTEANEGCNQLVDSHVNVNTTTSKSFTPSATGNGLLHCNFVFVVSIDDFDSTGNQLSSPLFDFESDGDSSSQSSSTASATSSASASSGSSQLAAATTSGSGASTAVPTTGLSTTAATATGSSIQSASTLLTSALPSAVSGLSTGAKIGIGAGAGVLGAGLLAGMAACFFCCRRRRRARRNESPQHDNTQHNSHQNPSFLAPADPMPLRAALHDGAHPPTTSSLTLGGAHPPPTSLSIHSGYPSQCVTPVSMTHLREYTGFHEHLPSTQETVRTPELVHTPEPVHAREPVHTPEMFHTPKPVTLPEQPRPKPQRRSHVDDFRLLKMIGSPSK